MADKSEIRRQIAQLREQMKSEKDKWKRLNEEHKRSMANFAASIKVQQTKEQKDSVRRMIASRKDLWQRNEKRFEQEAYARIRSRIEALKASL
jgi:P2-related tail formation protein